MGATADVLAPVKAVVQDVGTGLFGGVAPSIGAGHVAPSLLGLHLDLGVDLPLIHADNVQLNVGLLPAAPGQPLPSVGVGGIVGVGSPTGGASGLAANATLGLTGSSLVSANVGTQGQVTGIPVGIDPGARLNTSPVTATLPPLPVANAATQNQVAGIPVMVDATRGVNTPPASPTLSLPAAPAAPQTVGGVNPQTAALAGGTTSVPPPLTASAATAPTEADGGGAVADGAPAAALPAMAVMRVADGGGDPGPLPHPAAGGGRVVETTLPPEGAGLATHFQPFGPRVSPALGDWTARLAPSAGWLAALLARLRQWAPWLGGLAAAGAASVHEIRRRRRSLTVPQAIRNG